jgi:redox-sensitive bicupin YhaK (pirin superfamily)
MLDISLEEGAELSVPIAAGHCMFIMPIEGTVEVAAQRFNREDLKLPVFPAQEAPREVKLRAPQGSANVVLFSGPPLPFV